MMIWRGWGLLGVLLLIGGGALGTAVAKGGLGMGVGIILGAVACWFVGQQLNVERPKALGSAHPNFWLPRQSWGSLGSAVGALTAIA